MVHYWTNHALCFTASECWPMKNQHVHKMSVAEMMMLKWTNDKTIQDRVRNENIMGKLGGSTH